MVKRVADMTEEERAAVKVYYATRYKANRDKVCARQAAYRAINREKKNSYNSAYYKDNREKICTQVAAYRSNNPLTPEQKAKVRENSREWDKANPDRVRANARIKSHKRRALINASISDTITASQLAKIMEDPCVYCGDPSEHLDHVIPLSRGGTHTLDNLVPACKACNLSKSYKLPVIEWNGRDLSNDTNVL